MSNFPGGPDVRLGEKTLTSDKAAEAVKAKTAVKAIKTKRQ